MSMIYIVATPIGNLEDISLRAIRVLKEVDFIAAEDTRHSQKLLTRLHISTPLVAFHDFNEQKRYTSFLDKVAKGATMALISDAGTPLISDPGYRLIREAHQRGIPVSPIPGASAFVAALCASGLPTDRFVFEGFLPPKAKQRQDRLMQLRNEPRTLIFYESPHRILDLVHDLNDIFSGEREVALAKELTKAFETIYTAPLSNLQQWLLADPMRQKGEFVLIVAGESEVKKPLECPEERILSVLQRELPLKQAVALAAEMTGQPKNKLYKVALLQKQVE
jgi:16S rRNA (cytidine1402-2'-O)-methyltransferase